MSAEHAAEGFTALTDAEPSSPEVFPAESWAKGLMIPEEPVFLEVKGPGSP